MTENKLLNQESVIYKYHVIYALNNISLLVSPKFKIE